jgi:adenosylcobinamide-phosphate synthase
MLINSSGYEVIAFAIFVALAFDALFGEPPLPLHPVVWMGRGLDWASKHFVPTQACKNRFLNAKCFFLGIFYWVLLASLVWFVASVCAQLLTGFPPLLAALFTGFLLKPMLAWRMLRSEVLAVETQLTSSTIAGQQQLSNLVSRPVDQLSPVQIREAAIETLSENLNDSVIAPLFWFVLLGLPGAALYRFANTADAMWGYPAMRGKFYWQWAGKWAARVDDFLSWLPARITGFLMLLWHPKKLTELTAQANQTPSPNSGWPMAAMALALGVQLSKPGAYTLNGRGREVVAGDVYRAINLSNKTLAIYVVLKVALLMAFFK